MATKVSLVITDDFDGSPGAETVSFGLDGTGYEIDLAEPKRTRLSDSLAPFIVVSRRVSRARRPAGRSAAQRVDRAAVRAWARKAGLAVSERGRISADIMRQYEALTSNRVWRCPRSSRRTAPTPVR